MQVSITFVLNAQTQLPTLSSNSQFILMRSIGWPRSHGFHRVLEIRVRFVWAIIRSTDWDEVLIHLIKPAWNRTRVYMGVFSPLARSIFRTEIRLRNRCKEITDG